MTIPKDVDFPLANALRSLPREPLSSGRLTLTVEEFAAAVGISRNLAYDGVRSGAVPHIRVGRRILIPRIAVERWLSRAVA